MPPRPKPKVLRPPKLPATTGAIISLPVIPRCPVGLLPKSQERWRQFWSSPLVQVIVPELDLDGIETLFTLRDERDRALREGRKNRLILGSAGQQVLNPLLTYATNLQQQIRASEDRLAANPKARLILGVLFGDAHRSVDDVNKDLDSDDDLGDLLDDDALDRSTG